MEWIFMLLKSKIGRGALMVVGVALVIGAFYVQTKYWKGRAHKAEQAAVTAETETKMKDVEVKYAPEITRMRDVSKRSKARQAQPQTPEVKASELDDARVVADTINRMYGRKNPK